MRWPEYQFFNPVIYISNFYRAKVKWLKMTGGVIGPKIALIDPWTDSPQFLIYDTENLVSYISLCEAQAHNIVKLLYALHSESAW